MENIEVNEFSTSYNTEEEIAMNLKCLTIKFNCSLASNFFVSLYFQLLLKSQSMQCFVRITGFST